LRRCTSDLSLYEEFFDRIINFTIDQKRKPSSVKELIGLEVDRTIKQHESSLTSKLTILHGHSGSGKTVIFSLLFRYFCSIAKSDPRSPLPIFIDGDIYETRIYKHNDSYIEMRSDLQRYIEKMKSFAKERKRTNDVVVFIDGMSKRNSHYRDLIREICYCLERHPISNIYISVSDISNDEIMSLFRPLNIAGGPRAFSLSPQIAIESENDAHSFLSVHRHLMEKEKSVTLDESRNLLDRLSHLDFKKLDIYLVATVAKKIGEGKYDNIHSMSDFLDRFCMDEIARIANEFGGFSSVGLMGSAGRLAFKTSIQKKRLHPSRVEGRPEWFLVTRHNRIRDYLVAKFLVESVLKAGRSRIYRDYFVNNGLFFYDYPEDVNVFVKDIINKKSGQFGQLIITSISRILKIVPPSSRIYLYYLLGRFMDLRFSEQAKHMLREERDFVESANIPLIEKTVLVRTILMSLCYLGDEQAINEYLKILLSSDLARSVNLGFHRAYYGDYVHDVSSRSPHNPSFFDAERYRDSPSEDWSRSYTALYERVKRHLTAKNRAVDRDPAFKLRLFTLLSFVQSRMEEKVVDDNIRFSVLQLLKKIEEDKALHDEDELNGYCRIIYGDLKSRFFSPILTVLKIYRLKEERRRGWIDRGLDDQEKKIRAESVADHCFMTYWIAKLLLPPDKVDGRRYDKPKVLEMLLAHDLAEADVGDYNVVSMTSSQIDEVRSEERRRMSMFSVRESYSGIYSTRETYNLWREFETHDGARTFESTIAHDIDRLEILFQLEVYRAYLKGNDYDDFKSSVSMDLTTRWASGIAESIDEAMSINLASSNCAPGGINTTPDI